MDLNLGLSTNKKDGITETLPVPLSTELKQQIDALKKVCGKSVNEKIREFMWKLVEENKDKIAKAG